MSAHRQSPEVTNSHGRLPKLENSYKSQYEMLRSVFASAEHSFLSVFYTDQVFPLQYVISISFCI